MLPEGVTLDNWQSGPANRWSFQHVDDVVPTVVVSRGDGPVLALSEGPAFTHPGLDDFLTRTYTDGIVILKGREIVVERYFNNMTPQTRHLLMSVSKSLCSAVFGQYVATGTIDPTSLVSAYVPELANSGYADATVQHVLDMTASIAYDESYEDPNSEVTMHERVGLWRPALPGDPANTYEFLAQLRQGPLDHNATFQYCSANTDVLGWILERVTGQQYATLLAADLWSRLGAEHDAYVTVDAAGFPEVNGGVCTTLRDLARFGRLMLDDGTGPDGTSVVPPSWVTDVRRGGDPVLAVESMKDAHAKGSYRDQFWITGDDHGCFYGIGIYGQYVWMNPRTDVVIAKFSSLPVADDLEPWLDHVGYFETVSAALG
jgi:CubicO group peptidase (beta-lactamase class C family)